MPGEKIRWRRSVRVRPQAQRNGLGSPYGSSHTHTVCNFPRVYRESGAFCCDPFTHFHLYRLYVKGSIVSYKRAKTNQYNETSLIKIEGVESKEEVDFYLGKKIAFIYKAQTKKAGPNGPTKFRCIWGKVTRPHGSGGVVRATFRKPLPPKSLGAKCRVMLYPSQI